tara:strand:- start:2982 stop:3734 length:753 start_codon:yes stop_codon:yes gene_type:complete
VAYFPKKDFEWNLLNVYNYKKPGKFDSYFDFLRKNLDRKGDLIESGVFQGSSLLSVALFLKENNSDKIIYGFDSFSGFPKQKNKNDEISNFSKLFKKNHISKNNYDDYINSVEIMKKTSNFNKEYSSISSSRNFSNTKKENIEKKIKFLGLKNIKLIDGLFSTTMKNFTPRNRILGGILDCDLYMSYKYSLKYLWPFLEKKGLFYLDEYYSIKFPGARIACDEFIQENKAKLINFKSPKDSFERWGIKKI